MSSQNNNMGNTSAKEARLLFAPMAYARYDEDQTLPKKFVRMLERSDEAIH